MEYSYNIKFHKTVIYRGKTRTTYRVRWSVSGIQKWKTFRTKALSDSFRSDLVAAARRGEAFDAKSGVPVSVARKDNEVSWVEFAQRYVDMKWPDSAAKTRRSRAEALTVATVGLLSANTKSSPPEKILRKALMQWTFNTAHREEPRPTEIAVAIKWAVDHSPSLLTLSDPAVIRRVQECLAQRIDGTAAGSNYFNRRRMVLSNAFNYAIELGLISENPLARVKLDRARYKNRGIVDRRRLVNPVQARKIIDAVRWTGRSGPRLVAMFGAMYYAALRPEEAVNLRKHWLHLPDEGGWGTIYLERATPEAGSRWTTSGSQHDERSLKHRADDEARPVPCPPALTVMLNEHLEVLGTRDGGRLFWAESDSRKPVSTTTYSKIWSLARNATLTSSQVSSPLAKRPYDLRHAAVSTWLHAGVPPSQVAEWAGHSVDVLLRVYAACLDGQEEGSRKRIERALDGDDDFNRDDTRPSQGGEDRPGRGGPDGIDDPDEL